MEQLPAHELDTFVVSVLALGVQCDAPRLSHDESALLFTINQPIPSDLQQRYDALIASHRAEILTSDEHTELLRLADWIEQHEVTRVAALVELARLRRTEFSKLMCVLSSRMLMRNCTTTTAAAALNDMGRMLCGRKRQGDRTSAGRAAEHIIRRIEN